MCVTVTTCSTLENLCASLSDPLLFLPTKVTTVLNFVLISSSFSLCLNYILKSSKNIFFNFTCFRIL